MTIETVQSLDRLSKMSVHLVIDHRIACGVRMGHRGQHVWKDYVTGDDAVAATTCPRCRKRIDAGTHCDPPKPRAKRTPKPIVVDGVELRDGDLLQRRNGARSYVRNAIKYDGGRRGVKTALESGEMTVARLAAFERDDLPLRFERARRDRHWIDWVPEDER